MDTGLNGKVALVTGAASGIGRATALAFAREGARVLVVDRDGGGAEETVAILRNAGGEAAMARVDVAHEAEVVQMIEQATRLFGGVDVAFNNAGIEGPVGRTIADLTEAEFDRVIAVNLKGVWLCMKHEIPAMARRGGGAIVNCASIAGLVGFPGAAAYVASKHGIIGLTQTASLELARANIRVNAVCPGVIDTPMIDRATGDRADQRALYANAEPVGRLGRADEIASAVVWLSSPAASFVTGVAMPVDGGWVAQ
jgi:NAD(P)-dependent dehydrogenase (short-subunit alcohol dehydrogenase family)